MSNYFAEVVAGAVFTSLVTCALAALINTCIAHSLHVRYHW